MRPYLGRAQLPSEETVCRAASGQFAGVGVGRHENTRLSTAEARMGSARGGGGGGGTWSSGSREKGPKTFLVLSKGLPGPGAFYIRKDGTAGPVCFPDPSFSSTLGHRPKEASSLLALFCNYPVIYNPKNLRQLSIKAYTQHITTYYLGAKRAANLLGGAGPASACAVGAAGICCPLGLQRQVGTGSGGSEGRPQL